MTKAESYRYERVSEFEAGKITRRECAQLLQVTERTVSRMARRVEEKGVFGITHGSRGKVSSRRLDGRMTTRAMKLVKERYFDFNMVHCLEMLNHKHGIVLSYTSFRRLCHEENLVKKKVSRRVKIHKLRARLPQEGLLMQMDGSHHPWNGKDEWCLIGGIDDATSDVPYGEFFDAEGSLECMKVLREVVKRKGVPVAIYVDKAEWFGGAKKQILTQLTRACREVGIRVIHAHSPQAKGRIERLWATMQDRLVPEMRVEGIKTMAQANRYLQDVFIPRTWKKYTVKAREAEVKYKPVPPDLDLNEVFSIKEYRRINRDHSIRWKKNVFLIQHDFKQSLYRKFAEIRTYPDHTWRIFYAGKRLTVVPFMRNIKASDPLPKNYHWRGVTNSLAI